MNIDNYWRKYWNNPVFWEQYGLDSYYADRVSTVKGMLPSGITTILDVGVGKGDIVNSIYQEYSDVIAIDISIEALKYVKCPSQVGSVESLPYKSRKFDLVICLEVLEHLPKSIFQRGVSELQRVSNKYLIIGVPYKENIDYRNTCCPSCGGVFNADTHFRSFDSVASLIRWFPKFHHVSHTLTGPPSRSPTRLGIFIQQRIAGSYLLWPTYIVCLHCGFTGGESYPPNKSIIQRFAVKVNTVLSHLHKMQPYWMIVLLQRK